MNEYRQGAINATAPVGAIESIEIGNSVPRWTAEDENNLARRVQRASASRWPELEWAGPFTWVLEPTYHPGDPGAPFEVDVEPLSFGRFVVGDVVTIEGREYRIIGRRGRMVVTGS